MALGAVIGDAGFGKKLGNMAVLFGAGMGLVLVLRWLWERVNIYSELAAVVSSLVFAPLLLKLLPLAETEWLRLLFMADVTLPSLVSLLDCFNSRLRLPFGIVFKCTTK